MKFLFLCLEFCFQHIFLFNIPVMIFKLWPLIANRIICKKVLIWNMFLEKLILLNQKQELIWVSKQIK